MRGMKPDTYGDPADLHAAMRRVERENDSLRTQLDEAVGLLRAARRVQAESGLVVPGLDAFLSRHDAGKVRS